MKRRGVLQWAASGIVLGSLYVSLHCCSVQAFHPRPIADFRIQLSSAASPQEPVASSIETAPTKLQEETTVKEVSKEESLPTSTSEKRTPLQAPETTQATKPASPKPVMSDHSVHPVNPTDGFNVVLTHSTADFDSLASAVGLAKLWSAEHAANGSNGTGKKAFDSKSHAPTYVVLPRGAHPAVQRFLALHKHLFPIRSLKTLPKTGLNRLALVDAQRKERLAPAEGLLAQAQRITVVDHHVDQDSDIRADDYVVDSVGSVTTLIVERLKESQVAVTDAEATLMALGIHADTGSLCYDNTTPRDAYALAWCLSQQASQTAIAEHASSSLSPEQQSVLTRALLHVNTTVVHGVTVSTVLLQAEGFIQGLAAVTQDALDLSSSDIFLLGLVYSTGKKKDFSVSVANSLVSGQSREELKRAFLQRDLDQSGSLDVSEITAAMKMAGVIASDEQINKLVSDMDMDGDGSVDIDEFIEYFETHQNQLNSNKNHMIVVGRVKASANLKAVRLNDMLEPFGGGGHPKAASATIRVHNDIEGAQILQSLVDQVIDTSLPEQPTVGDFMMSPVLSVTKDMTDKQVEDLFTRYDVRALPVVDADDNVVGLVTYKEVAAAKQRAWNKEQKRLRRERQAAERGEVLSEEEQRLRRERRHTTVKAWMKQHVPLVEADYTLQQVETILLETDEGSIPVVVPGTRQLAGMVTRTDLLRQHRYYTSLPYHNKGMADSIAARKPIIELRKRLKQFDLD